MPNVQDLLQPIGNSQSFIFAKHTFKNMFFDNEYVELLHGNQSASGSRDSYLYFDNKFYVPYGFSYSSFYQSVAFFMRHVTENDYDKVGIQKYPGIWKTPTLTSSVQSVTDTLQGIGISNYYYDDEVANGTYKLYYYPIISTSTGSLSSMQSQNVLKFFDVNKNLDSPTFSISGTNTLKTNLSGTTTGMSIELYSRFVGQDKEGYLFHRHTTNSSSSIITSYNDATTASVASYSSYSAYPYYGIGCYYNFLTSLNDADKENPYIDFYVYGELTGSSAHYLNLTSNTVNQQSFTRFYLTQSTLDTIFDGSFHALRFVWSIESYYKHGRIYIDNVELSQDSINGSGRTSALKYAVTGFGNVVTTPMYILSKADDKSLINTQTSSQYTTYSETKHVVIFDKAISGTICNTNSVTSNQALYNAMGSTSSNVGAWFGFNSYSALSTTAVDLSQSFSSRSTALTGYIVNDVTNQTNLEGKIDKVYSLLHDKRGTFATSIFDGALLTGSLSSISNQNVVGKIYNTEYDQTNTEHIGYIFYDKAIMILMNDAYNTSYSASTQLFISSSSSKFSISSSTADWQINYLSFAGTKYISRQILSVTADSNYFCKSTNQTAVFEGTDSKPYSKSNTKVITGVVWYDKNGIALATTKFAKPIIKKEDNAIAINVNLDL